MGKRLFRDPGLSYTLGAAYGLVATASILVGDFFARTVVGRAVAPFDRCWLIAYGLGAAFIAAAAACRAADHGATSFPVGLEGGGLVCLMTGYLLNGTVALVVQPGDPRSWIFYVLLTACACRLLVLIRG